MLNRLSISPVYSSLLLCDSKLLSFGFGWIRRHPMCSSLCAPFSPASRLTLFSKFALHVLLISSARFLDFLLCVSQIGFHEEFPNSNEFRNHLPSLPTHSLFIKSTLNPSIFCCFPFCLYLGQSASWMCVERFITHSGRIPPAFRITFRTLVSCFPGLSLSRSLLGSWLFSKPYSPSSSTLSPRLLTHALLSTFSVA